MILEHIVAVHLDEVVFLWLLRDRAICARHYGLWDLLKFDDRFEAHVDGLSIAASDGWRPRAVGSEEPGKVFAASAVALRVGDEFEIQQVLKVAEKDPALASGFISALGWLDYQQAEPHIKRLCVSSSPAEKRIGIAAAAIHRKDPGRPLNEAISDPDLLLRARALRAVGELSRIDLIPLIQRDLTAKDVNCRFWSAWSVALLAGYGNAIDIVNELCKWRCAA